MSSKKPEASPVSPFHYTDRFEWLREINRGGLGRIELALEPTIGRLVAVKTMLPEIRDRGAAVEFAKEAQITGQLDHPNIVPVYELLEGEGGPAIVMKLIRGKSLAELIAAAQGANGKPELLRRFVQIVLRLCDALSFAHSRGVVHCDVKPANVMVGDYGQVYLMDWGLAVVLQADADAADEEPASLAPASLEPASLASVLPGLVFDATDDAPDTSVRINRGRSSADPTAVRGTPGYMSPEQFQGRVSAIDQRTDVFGLGGILHEILTGAPPNDWKRLRGPGLNQVTPLPTQSPLWSHLPPELRRITSKALAPNPAERHPTIEALRRDLERFSSGGGWFETRVFAAGERIVTEGERGDAAYIIESGQCEVFKDVRGECSVLRRLGPGDVFGETAVLTGAPRSASVRALEETTVKVITGESLNHELDGNPWLAAFVRSLAALFREVDSR